jgi:hypothetical protein
LIWLTARVGLTLLQRALPQPKSVAAPSDFVLKTLHILIDLTIDIFRAFVLHQFPENRQISAAEQ